ncbi:MAG: hypothetical protein HYS61_05830 [Acidobacteria bacterium]|nr:hypothetical protein [Acidobacteriota bacterium]
MKRTGILMLAIALGALAAFSHEQHESREVKLVGEVIDTACYVSHDSRGPDHLECARECAAQGISLGILEEKTGRVYISLPVDHSNPNAKLTEFIAKRVEVKGTVFTKGGLKGLFVQSVRELPAAPSGGASQR